MFLKNPQIEKKGKTIKNTYHVVHHIKPCNIDDVKTASNPHNYKTNLVDFLLTTSSTLIYYYQNDAPEKFSDISACTKSLLGHQVIFQGRYSITGCNQNCDTYSCKDKYFYNYRNLNV